MKPVHTILAIVLGFVAISIVVTMSRYGVEPLNGVSRSSPNPFEKDAMAPPTSGPFGKAVAKETTFDFGTLQKGDTGSHIFVLTNEGEGPLKIKNGGTSCVQCTVQHISRDEIAPGESAEIEVQWNIKADEQKFRQVAFILTNDPKNPKLEFAIMGLVDKTWHLAPSTTWPVGDLREGEPTEVSGMLFSTLIDQISVERAECDNPLVNVRWEPASPAEITEMNALSAVKIIVTFSPAMPVGPVRDKVKLYAQIRGETEVEFGLSGKKPGPIEVKGKGWNPENNVIVMGTFDAEKGAKAKLSMYVRNFDGDLKVEQENADQGRVRVRVLEEGKTFGKAKAYTVEVEVLPGAPILRHASNVEPVRLKMNHPKIPDYMMYVDYYAK